MTGGTYARECIRMVEPDWRLLNWRSSLCVCNRAAASHIYRLCVYYSVMTEKKQWKFIDFSLLAVHSSVPDLFVPPSLHRVDPRWEWMNFDRSKLRMRFFPNIHSSKPKFQCFSVSFFLHPLKLATRVISRGKFPVRTWLCMPSLETTRGNHRSRVVFYTYEVVWETLESFRPLALSRTRYN